MELKSHKTQTTSMNIDLKEALENKVLFMEDKMREDEI